MRHITSTLSTWTIIPDSEEEACLVVMHSTNVISFLMYINYNLLESVGDIAHILYT